MFLSPQKSWLLLVLCASLFLIALLIGPRVPPENQDKECVKNLDLIGPFGLSINCDSGLFVEMSHVPSKLFEKGNARASRPTMIWLCHLMSYPLRPANFLLHRFLKPQPDPRFSDKMSSYLSYTPEFLAYAIINFSLLILSVFLIFSVWNMDKAIHFIVLPVSFLVIANDMVKAFYWSPHTELFNIVVPLASVWLIVKSWQTDLFQRRKVFLIAALLGFGQTAYASFVVAIPALLLSAFFKYRRNSIDFWKRSTLVVVLFTLPVLFWHVILYLKTGQMEYYRHETKTYRQVIWIFDQSVLKTTNLFFQHFIYILRSFVHHNWILVIATFVIAGLGLIKRVLLPEDRIILTISVGVSLMMSLFWSLVGYFPWRMVFTILPPLFVILGISMYRLYENTTHKRLWTFLVYGFTVVWTLYTLIK